MALEGGVMAKDWKALCMCLQEERDLILLKTYLTQRGYFSIGDRWWDSWHENLVRQSMKTFRFVT